MSLAQAELPYNGIASVLFEKLECEDTPELRGAVFKSLLFLMALSEKIIYFGGSWWKSAIETYEILSL